VLNKPTGSNKTRNLYVNFEFNLQNWSILNFVKNSFLTIFFSNQGKNLFSHSIYNISLRKELKFQLKIARKRILAEKSCSKALKIIVENLNWKKKKFIHDIQKWKRECKNIDKMYVIKSELYTKLQIYNKLQIRSVATPICLPRPFLRKTELNDT